MSIKLITDGSIDVPEDIVAEYDITVVPPVVIVGSEQYLSGVDITPAEFFEQQRTSPVLPRTSQPSPGQFIEAFEQALKTHDRIFYIAISSALSGTLNSAQQAAKQFPPDAIVMHDSLSLSAAAGMQVVAAAKALAAGASMEETLAVTRATAQATTLFFSVDDLSFLIKGGRIGRVAGAVGTLFNIRPIITVDKAEGVFEPLTRVRSFKAVMRKMVEMVVEEVGAGGPARIIIMYGETLPEAEALETQLREAIDVKWFRRLIPAPTMLAHTGPRALAVAVAPGEW